MTEPACHAETSTALHRSYWCCWLRRHRPYLRDGIWRPNVPTDRIFAPWWFRPPTLCEVLRVRGDGRQAAAALDRLGNDKIRGLPDSAIAKVVPV